MTAGQPLRTTSAGDAVLGIAAGTVVAVGSAVEGLDLGVGAILLLVALTALLAVRRWRPTWVLAAVLVVAVGFLSLVGPTAVLVAPLALALYTVGAHGSRRRTLVVGALTIPAAFGLAAFSPEDGSSLSQALELLAWLNLALVLGEAVRVHRALLGSMAERARRAESSREEEARRRVGEERVRIARELHDVVAHSIATIDTQASVGLYLADRDPERAKVALRAVRSISGGALRDLRTALVSLRERDEDAPVEPTPGLGELPRLVERARSSGNAVDLRIEGPTTELPSAVGLAAYRIVQEALTNVMRHAAGASAHVQVISGPETLEVEVEDDGRGTASDHTPLGTGSGLAGMRERALGIGGEFEAGPLPAGGFGVRARLPLGARAR